MALRPAAPRLRLRADVESELALVRQKHVGVRYAQVHIHLVGKSAIRSDIDVASIAGSVLVPVLLSTWRELDIPFVRESTRRIALIWSCLPFVAESIEVATAGSARQWVPRLVPIVRAVSKRPQIAGSSAGKASVS